MKQKHNMYAMPNIPKIISLATAHGSLEDPRLKGMVFVIVRNAKDYASFGSAKKYLLINGNSVLKFDQVIVNFKVGYMETTAEVFGYDTGLPEEMNTKIYFIKKNIMLNQKNKDEKSPTILVEKNGKSYYTNHLMINGPSTMIYDLENYHELGGKVRIETNAELEGISE
jgi:hypothetical protein